jgi:hypothetical protein
MEKEGDNHPISTLMVGALMLELITHVSFKPRL